jgi:indole-3-glycerol phosphate synthase
MSILDEIVGHKRHEVAAQKVTMPRRMLEARCATLAAPRDFERALAPVPGRARLVAEVKRASPSRGVLKADLDPVALASTYARHRVDAISVLTDARYFRGSLDDLAAVRAAVDVPLLRKDFTLDEYQLWEARAAGADAVLLIVAILEPSLLSDLAAAAKGLGLAALVECHTARELDIALAAGARLIGINNRDLTTFETRIDTTLALLPQIPPGPTVVSESGFFSGADVRRVIQAGAHAVLVGEGLVKAADVGAKVRELTLSGVQP